MTRQYIPYLLKGPKRGPFVKWYNPGLRPMTIKEAATFRSKQTEPASWGIEEITPDTPSMLRAHASAHGQRIDPVWLESPEAIEA